MGKELVISANRHETKVAILEDDQLVEIYFQRANEYSLAGSIQKGRVTRVLPGMQSAFVDIGLERDAFLYVSDFFEEHEEYDRMSSPSEERVRRAEPAEAPAPVQPEAKAAAPPAVERTGDADARDRAGRRSRRRRSRGRGFPESKYAPEAAEGWSRPPEIQPVAPAAGDDFMVLPGESLAKYRGETLAESPAPGTEAEPEELEMNSPSAEEISVVEETESEPLAAVKDAAADEPVEPETEFPFLAVAAAEEDSSEEPEPEAVVVGEEAGEAADESPEETEALLAEAIAETAGGSPEDVPSGNEPPEEAPAAASAGLRERGQRYLHRVSRRTRRKQRGSAPMETRGAAPAAPEVTVPRAEAAERSEKAAPSIADLLREGQEVLVQVAKEPLGQKGARITSHIALPGRYVVYMPTVEHLGVSRKIASDEERLRLKRILQTHGAGIPGGFIVRTAGTGRSEKDIAADMMFLYNLWLDIRQKAEKRKAPALIHHDLDVVQRLLRDQLTDGFKAIWVDNEDLYASVLQFIERLQPALVSRVKLYTRPAPIFDVFNITAELEKALRPKVWLKSGGYIVVNQTEALVAIDINTGKFVGKSARLEDTIVKTNTEAIKEIVRQIRLRDLGGIIVIDFIDMDERKNRQKVMQALEEEMRKDRAPNKILQFNDFGLVAITRKRVKQSLERALCAPCPSCEGSGYVKSVQTVIGEILQEALKIAATVEGTNVVLRVHPDVAKTLKSTDNDYLEELEEILRRPVVVKGDAELHPEKFDLA